ncbi:BTB/POZ domain-containing protein KCTD7-like [Haliotis rufescens]|uniref:BTB/POZ domain-containing protein KCTD7-like n=1 Tax=Haliotis rufescens TaxID=6454 RepID=UPI00201E9F90|nr:BTB/POZ domain-containing protein KCTD7-like [Haliotis rufescens]
MAFPQIIDLNVGGRHLSTRISTLTKYPDSKLADMFSGEDVMPKDKDGRFFIDADGDVFAHILNFLRYEMLPPPDQAAAVHKYANIFGIKPLLAKHLQWGPVFAQALRDKWKRGIAGYDDCLNQVREGLVASRYHSGVLYIQFSDSSQHMFTLCKVAGIPEGHQVINVKYSSSTMDGTNLVHFLNEDLKRIGVHLQPGDFRPEPKCGCRVAFRYMIKLE